MIEPPNWRIRVKLNHAPKEIKQINRLVLNPYTLLLICSSFSRQNGIHFSFCHHDWQNPVKNVFPRSAVKFSDHLYKTLRLKVAWFAPRMLPTPLKETHRRIVGNCLLVVPTSGRARKVSWHLQWPHCCDPNIWPWFCKVAKTSNVVSPFRLRYWILVRLVLAHYNAPGQIPFSFKKLQDTFWLATVGSKAPLLAIPIEVHCLQPAGNFTIFLDVGTFLAISPQDHEHLPSGSNWNIQYLSMMALIRHVPLRLPWAQRIHFTQNHLEMVAPPKINECPPNKRPFFSKKNHLPTINFPSVCSLFFGGNIL